MTQDQPPAPLPKRWLYVGIVAFALIVGVLVAVSFFRDGDESSGAATDTAALTDTTFTDTTATDTTSTDGMTTSTATVATMYDGFPSEGLTIGKEDAPITVIEVAEPQCPHCARASEALLPQIVEHLVQAGEVRLQLVPISFISPVSASDKAVRAIYAAGEQGRAWPFAHVLYSRQGQEGTDWLTDDLLRGVARDIGLDADRFDADRTSSAADDAATASRQTAQELNVDSTPTFVVRNTTTGRQYVSTENTFDDIRDAVDRLKG